MTHRIEETLARGICIGCGACGAVTDGAVKLTLGPTRLYRPDLGDATEEQVRSASRVCPFSDESPNESELGAPRSNTRPPLYDKLGAYTYTFAGRVADADYLEGSSSGGLTSWLARRLMQLGRADAVISVGPGSRNEGELFEYALRNDDDSLRTARKSHYYAATMSDVLQTVSGEDRRFILIGVPCFVRSVRALCRERPELESRFAYLFALVCGHYKTQAFAESLAWQIGVEPDDLDAVDFRLKSTDRPANDYQFGARSSTSQRWQTAPVRDLVGGNWGHSAFQPEACNFCDDVVGETADISFGDAWLPQFASDPRGTNIVISRNLEIDDVFNDAHRRQEIEIFEASPEDAVASQAGGFRHRRDGLSVRLADDLAAGLSVPRKRVAAIVDGTLSGRRVALFRQRRRMAESSHAAFAAARAEKDLDIYLKHQKKEMAAYARIEMSFGRRLLRRIKRLMRYVLNGVSGQ